MLWCLFVFLPLPYTAPVCVSVCVCARACMLVSSHILPSLISLVPFLWTTDQHTQMITGSVRAVV